MTLQELLQSLSDSEILQECLKLDQDNLEDAYTRALGNLRNTTPICQDKSFVIQISGAGPDRQLCDVSGIHPPDKERYGIEFVPWAEWLAAEVRVNNVDLTPAQMVAQCLYEMTFISFEEEEIAASKEDMLDAVETIKQRLEDEG